MPLLEKIEPQHALQSYGRTSAPAVRIVRLENRQESAQGITVSVSARNFRGVWSCVSPLTRTQKIQVDAPYRMLQNFFWRAIGSNQGFPCLSVDENIQWDIPDSMEDSLWDCDDETLARRP
jgi:hypothetical protein